MTVYIVCLEPLEERYTTSWYKNIPLAFEETFDHVVVIDGEPLSDYVGAGTFLDINSTVHYKSMQLAKISKLFFQGSIKNGDIFFVADIEFWGIESIRFMADLQGIRIGLFGFCHAASYTIEDFMEPTASYSRFFELGWLAAFDLIFVGTEYHKNAIIERRIQPLVVSEIDKQVMIDKIVVTGNPLFLSDYELASVETPKLKQLIISNRFDWEKRPNLSLDFCYILKRRIPDLNIIVTTSRPKFKSNKKWLVELARCMENDGIIKIYEGLSKRQYHALLAESRIFLTNTIEENFGYCLIEAIIHNTYPLAENKYSHPELLMNDSRFLFDDTDDIIPKALALLDSDYNISDMSKRYYQSMDRIMGSIYLYKYKNGNT